MMKVKFFGSGYLDTLEAEINEWMSKEEVRPGAFFKVCQTESESGWTVSVWYLKLRRVPALE